MNWFASAVLYAWTPIALGLFWFLPPRRAALTVLVTGWLFLPVAGLDLPALHDKGGILAASLLVGTFLLAPWRNLRPKLQMADWAMLLFCTWPMVTTLANGLGWYDAASAVAGMTMDWGVPWMIGRRFFSDEVGMQALAKGIFVGGLVYLPLAIWEIRMSPQLHATLYGFAQHSFLQTYKWGTYRPMLFLNHGLAVALWMVAAALVALWLERARIVRDVLGIQMKWAVGALYVTAILCKSVGAFVLLGAGTAVLLLWKQVRGGILLAVLVAIPPTYIASRVVFAWSGAELVEAATDAFGAAQAGSLKFRLVNDRILIDQAIRRPITGWGGWGRFNPALDEDGRRAVPDAMWILILGTWGAVGLSAVLVAMLLPVASLAARVRSLDWDSPGVGVTIPLGIVVGIAAAGALSAYAPQPRRVQHPRRLAGRARSRPPGRSPLAAGPRGGVSPP
jgi:hypothetical protein